MTDSTPDLASTGLRDDLRPVRWAVSQAEFVPIVDPPPGGVAGLGCSAGIESRPLVGHEREGLAGDCLGISREERDLGRFRRNIVALKVHSGRRRIGIEAGFRAECEDIDARAPTLPPRFAGKIRSIQPL